MRRRRSDVEAALDDGSAPLHVASHHLPPRDGEAAQRWAWRPLLLLLATVVIAYAPIFNAGFVSWDDPFILTRNATLTPPSWSSLGAWWTTPHEGLYTPAAYTVWGGIAALAWDGEALRPLPFHVANLLVHLAAVGAAHRLLWRLVGRAWPAAAGTAVFALHPLAAESVCHASGLQGLLCTLLALTATLLALTAMGRPTPASRWAWWMAASAVFVLSLLSKPLGAVTPLLVGIEAVMLLGQPWPRVARQLAPWMILSIAFLALTKRLQPAPPMDVSISWFARPFVAADAVAFYLYKVIWPAKLGIVYGRTPSHIIRNNDIFYTWLIPVALAAILWRERRRLRPLAAAAMLFVAGMLPVLGLVRFNFQSFSTVADRYAHLPLFAVALAGAWLLSQAPCLRRPALTTILCTTVLIALGTRTFLQARVWRDSDALFRNAYHVNPAGGPRAGRGG